jgi:magnesium chelatase subunit D
VFQLGILRAAAGGVLMLAMAERLAPSTAGHVAAALDAPDDAAAGNRVGLPGPDPDRQGLGVGVVALDEASERTSECRPADGPACLPLDAGCRRLVRRPDADEVMTPFTRERVLNARLRLPQVRIGAEIIEAFCAAALTLGVDSLRAPLLAVRAARAAASLDGRREVDEHDAAMAARLVLASRATTLPPVAHESGDGTAPQGEDDPAGDAVPTGGENAAADAVTPPAEEADGSGHRGGCRRGRCSRAGRGPSGQSA